MLLFRRVMPIISAMVSAGCLYWQAGSAGTYPWVAAMAPITFAAAAVFIGWKRISLSELAVRVAPSVLALASAAYGLLLAEGIFASVLIPLFGGVISFVALTLLFFVIFLPSRYPVNGLSYFNLALVPVVLWLVQYASVGLTMFVHASRWIPLSVLAGTGAMLFWSTAHVESEHAHRRRWSMLGAWIGVQLGLLGLLLPVEIILHGGYAALLGAFALRARRYGIAPRVSRPIVWAEAVGGVLLLAVMLATARWT
ncbi:MAG: hypothetical protein RL141_1021 [Candidatus Parcubacteria bacterium]|jgi:hypothetical protein